MNAKTIILTIILFALIVAGMFVYTKLKKSEQLTSVYLYDAAARTSLL